LLPPHDDVTSFPIHAGADLDTPPGALPETAFGEVPPGLPPPTQTWLPSVPGAGAGTGSSARGSIGLGSKNFTASSAGTGSSCYDSVALDTSASALVVQFSADDLSKATNQFGEKSLIDEGAFGTVYRGKLPRSALACGGQEVAIKVLKLKHVDGGDNKKFSGAAQFEMEAQILGKYRHTNIVALLGTGAVSLGQMGQSALQPCLVYEFMPGQSLKARLRLPGQSNAAPKKKSLVKRLRRKREPADDPSKPLNPRTRFSIASDVARGLAFLHTACDPPIIHQDIKSDNILLGLDPARDGALVAKLADFGTVRLMPQNGDMQTTTCRHTPHDAHICRHWALHAS